MIIHSFKKSFMQRSKKLIERHIFTVHSSNLQCAIHHFQLIENKSKSFLFHPSGQKVTFFEVVIFSWTFNSSICWIFSTCFGISRLLFGRWTFPVFRSYMNEQSWMCSFEWFISSHSNSYRFFIIYRHNFDSYGKKVVLKWQETTSIAFGSYRHLTNGVLLIKILVLLQ